MNRGSKYVSQQRNHKEFVNLIKRLYPKSNMPEATYELSKDLYNSIIFKEDIIKKLRRAFNEKEKK